LSSLAEESCLSYRVDLRSIAHERRPRYHGRQAVRVGRDLMISPDLWLWRPFAEGQPSELLLHFDLPEEIDVSAPWRLVERSSRTVTYRTGKTPTDWSAAVALGRFAVEEITLANSSLRFATLDGSPRPDPLDTRSWLRHAGESLLQLYGRFPLPSVQILVVPVRDGDEAVPFAQVLRGGGSALRFFVDPRYPLQDFISDWTAVHEFSHLVHPYFPDRDVWLAEGIASYYQNVLRARKGVLSPRRAWQKLHEGFQRGIHGTDGRSLEDVADSMHRDGSYMRVYWSGAAVALLADLRLRNLSAGRQSLDSALALFQTCCLPSERLWEAREFMYKLDELSRTSVFSELYHEYAQSSRFPDLRGAYSKLGLDDSREQIRLLDKAPSQAVRDAIMAQR